jgi:hypothetical protein
MYVKMKYHVGLYLQAQGDQVQHLSKLLYHLYLLMQGLL